MMRQRGFTLLELLVAITLMALILVALYGGLRLAMNSWDSGEERADTTNRLRLAQEFIRRQLTLSIPAYYFDEQRQRAVAFSGDAEQITFVAPMLAQFGQGGLYRVRIYSNDGRLLIQWRPYLPSEPEAGELRESVLLEGVSALEWAYFGADPEANNPNQPPANPQWENTWAQLRFRPQLVRLNLKLHDQVWPDLVIALTNGRL